eukprot:g5845.t1
MVKNGVAGTHQFNLMLKLCTSSDEIRDVIDVAMPEAGVKPNVVTYSTLIGMLRIEGDDEAAKKVVEEMKKAMKEMKKAKVRRLNEQRKIDNEQSLSSYYDMVMKLIRMEYL